MELINFDEYSQNDRMYGGTAGRKIGIFYQGSNYIVKYPGNLKEQKMKNIDEKILMAEEEIKQLQNKRKKLISQQKQEERKKRDKRLYEKGAVFESIFTESKDFTKDEFYQLISFSTIKEAINQKILKIIEKREQSENKITEIQEEETEIEK